jgi:hypothetical protein
LPNCQAKRRESADFTAQFCGAIFKLSFREGSMTNTNLTLFICDVMTALGAIAVLLGLIVILLSVNLKPAIDSSTKGKDYVVTASKHLRTGLAVTIIGSLLIAMSSVLELIIY